MRQKKHHKTIASGRIIRAARRYRWPLLMLAVLMAAGGLLIVRTSATTWVRHTEAETGSVASPAAACPASGASGGQAVRFGHTGCSASWPKYSNPVFPVEPGGNTVWHDGYYYTPVKLGGEPRVRMMKARWLNEHKHIDSDAARTAQKVIWDGAGTPLSGFINWPVAMYKLRGKWYIYAFGSNRNPPDFSDRLYVLESDTDDPMGSWTLKPRIGPDRWVIGYSAFEWQDKLYMVVSTREGHTSGTHHALAIAEMSNPWTIIGDWKTLTDPEYTWEKWGPDGSGKAPINEVDQAIIHNGKLHLFYSASHVASPNYTAGLLTYDGSGSLTDRDNWSKRSTPILSRTGLTAGPGQTFVFKSPDGKTDYLGYAYWNTPNNLSPRPIGIVPIRWDSNDFPIVNPPPDPGSQFDEPMKP